MYICKPIGSNLNNDCTSSTMKMFILTLLGLSMLFLAVDAQTCEWIMVPGIAAMPPHNCPHYVLDFNKKMQKKIVDYHNSLRSSVTPTAADMEYMYWDDVLAAKALHHSAQCVFVHDSYEERALPGVFAIGQNLYASSTMPDILAPIKTWHAQVEHFTFGMVTNQTVGHYTQVVQNRAARIGCGGAFCPDLWQPFIITCNYMKGQYDTTNPYTLGEPCASCKSKCRDNMCDCQGRVCRHGGEINLNTCNCMCKGFTYGELCENVNCNIIEHPDCYVYAGHGYCDIIYGYFTRTKCPISCGLCP